MTARVSHACALRGSSDSARDRSASASRKIVPRLAQCRAQHDDVDRRIGKLQPRAERRLGISVVSWVALAASDLDVARCDAKCQCQILRRPRELGVEPAQFRAPSCCRRWAAAPGPARPRGSIGRSSGGSIRRGQSRPPAATRPITRSTPRHLRLSPHGGAPGIARLRGPRPAPCQAGSGSAATARCGSASPGEPESGVFR